MSHYLKNLVPSEELIAEVKKSGKMFFRTKNTEAMHRYSLFHQPIRFRGPDGRTFDRIDENGKYISHFISQHSPLISDNLEPGVALLVRVLHSKGFLTLGSCQGHEDSPFRWISLVFTEETQMQQFIKFVDGLKLPISWYDNFLNYREKPRYEDDDGFQLAFTWEQIEVNVRSLKGLRQQGYTEAELTRYLNMMFSSKHSKYFLVKMVICSKMGDKSFFEKWKWKRLYKKRDEVTEKLVKALFESL